MIREKLKFKFTGYDNYPIDEVIKMIEKHIKDRETSLRLILAVNEAVCNAARYSINLLNECKIKIKIYVKDKEIIIIVSSKTVDNSAIGIRKKMYRIADKNRNSDWGEATRNKLNGRGLWIMLQGVSKLVVDEQMNWISLRKKFDDTNISAKPIDLLKKMKINKVIC